MAVIYQDNFDSYGDGVLNNNPSWNGDSEFVVQGIEYYSAPKAVKCPNAGGDFEYDIYHALTAMTEGYFAFYIKIAGGSDAEGGVNFQQDAMIGLNILFASDSKIYVNYTGGMEVLQTYQKGQWYRVVVQLKQEGEPLYTRFKIQNGSWSDWKEASDSQENVNRFVFYGHPVDSDIYYDDVVVSTTEPLPTSEYTTQNWGLMAKSQIDSETIEEAINRLIEAHNDDPESHLDTGQSLQSHKAEAIIDHIAGSVLADKLSHSEDVLKTNFDSLDNWQTSGSVSLDEWPGAYLYIEYGAVNESILDTTIVYPENWLDYSKNILFQFTGWITAASNSKHYANLGTFNAVDNIEGFGFNVINGVVKGHWGKGASITYTAAISIDESAIHVFRAYYDADLQNVKFYVDGVYVATIENIGLPAAAEAQIEFRSIATDTIDGYFHIKNLMVSRGV